MKVYILDEEFELDNKIESIEEIFEYIKQALEETEYNFSYMIVDGEEVHDEFELYLEGKIKTIDEVKIIMLTRKEIVRDNLFTIEEYISRAIPIIKDLANNFYKQPSNEDWNQIGQLFEGIGFIFHTLESVDSMENLEEIIGNYQIWNEYAVLVKSLNSVLVDFDKAVEDKNTGLIGDLLSSKVVPVFETMKEKLNILLEVK